MLQLYLRSNNGLLCLGREGIGLDDRETPVDLEWIKSELDNIHAEEVVSNHIRTSQTRGRQHERYLRRSITQHRLYSSDGSLRLCTALDLHNLVLKPCETPQDLTSTGGIDDSIPVSSLLFLPVELRMPIYHHLLVGQDTRGPICPDVNNFRLVLKKSFWPCSRLYPEILRTCKKIYNEALPVLYGENLFQQEFFWPQIYPTGQPWPRARSCPLSVEKLQLIRGVYLFRQYRQWFLTDEELKVFHKFPGLTNLHIRLDLNDYAPRLDLGDFLQKTVLAVSQRNPLPKRFTLLVRLRFDRDYYNWCERCRGKKLDYSLHMTKKIQLENWMKKENIFPQYQKSWSFMTGTSEYVGPDCRIELVIDTTISESHGNGIPCRIEGDYDEEEFVMEP